MCGLAGAVRGDGVDAAVLPEMADSIAHRGPDGRGYLLWRPGDELRMRRSVDGAAPGEATVGLVHNRLSIIDLRPINDQPLVSEDGSLALAFNGEVYNYVELRSELESMGHEFRTSGDTEVLLAAYREWGPACVERFVGMWAFALLDAANGRLLLSRDRFGIKPLYYALTGGAIYFASEIKALLRVPGFRPEPDEAAVRRYLLTGGVDETDGTFFEGVRSLPAAHNAIIPLDRPAAEPRAERYWSIPEEGHERGASRRRGSSPSCSRTPSGCTRAATSRSEPASAAGSTPRRSSASPTGCGARARSRTTPTAASATCPGTPRTPSGNTWRRSSSRRGWR